MTKISRLINEIGNHYGRLVVIERGENGKSGEASWLCKCSCGNEKFILGTSLRLGKTRSCGCLQKEVVSKIGKAHALPIGEASFNALISKMKQRANRRNHEWSLTKDHVRLLTKQNCHYCGVEPQQKLHPSDCNGVYIYNGLDRVDNSKGYTIDNVVACCKFCNVSKNSRTIEQFRMWLTRAYKHYIEKSDGATK